MNCLWKHAAGLALVGLLVLAAGVRAESPTFFGLESRAATVALEDAGAAELARVRHPLAHDWVPGAGDVPWVRRLRPVSEASLLEGREVFRSPYRVLVRAWAERSRDEGPRSRVRAVLRGADQVHRVVDVAPGDLELVRYRRPRRNGYPGLREQVPVEIETVRADLVALVDRPRARDEAVPRLYSLPLVPGAAVPDPLPGDPSEVERLLRSVDDPREFARLAEHYTRLSLAGEDLDGLSRFLRELMRLDSWHGLPGGPGYYPHDLPASLTLVALKAILREDGASIGVAEGFLATLPIEVGSTLATSAQAVLVDAELAAGEYEAAASRVRSVAGTEPWQGWGRGTPIAPVRERFFDAALGAGDLPGARLSIASRSTLMAYLAVYAGRHGVESARSELVDLERDPARREAFRYDDRIQGPVTQEARGLLGALARAGRQVP